MKFRKVYLTSSVIIVLLLQLQACQTLHNIDSDTSHLVCKFELIVPLESKTEKVTGVIKMLRDESIQISFRAPIVRSELVFLEYSPSRLFVVDRTNKKYANAAYPVQNTKGIDVLSFDLFQDKLLKAATSSKRQMYFFASDFGWYIFGNATVKIHQFKAQNFELKSPTLSKKYKDVTIQNLLEELGI